MICSNCGSQVPEGSKFCQVCGAKTAESLMNEPGQNVQNEMNAQPQQQFALPQQQYAQPQQQFAQPQQFGQAYAPAAVAKKGLGTGVKVLIAILSVVAVLGIVFAVFSSQIINFFKQMTMSDAEYMQAKTLDATSDFTDLAVLSYGKASGDGTGAEITFDVELGDGLLNMLKLSGADLSWFKNVGGNVNFSASSEAMGGEMAVKLNGTVLATANIVLDGGKLYISVPELTDKVAVVDVKKIAESQKGYDTAKAREAIQKLEDLAKALPDPDKAEELVNRYLKVIVESIENVEKTSDTYTVDSVSQKASLYTAKMTSVEIKKIAENVLKTLRDDADVKKIIEDVAKVIDSEDLTYEKFKEEIANSLDHIDNIEFEGVVYYKMWVNSSGEILGTEFTVDSEEVKLQVRGRSAYDGDKFSYEEIAVVNGQSILLVGGSGTKSGDRITGSFLVNFNGMNMMTVSCEDYDVESVKEGHPNGKISVSFEKDFIKAVMEKAQSGLSDFNFMAVEGSDMIVNMLSNLKITCSFDSSTGHCKTELKIMMGESEYLKATFELNETGFRKYSVPAGSKVEVEDEADLEDWIDEFDPSKLFSSLKKAGVPEELFEELN